MYLVFSSHVSISPLSNSFFLTLSLPLSFFFDLLPVSRSPLNFFSLSVSPIYVIRMFVSPALLFSLSIHLHLFCPLCQCPQASVLFTFLSPSSLCLICMSPLYYFYFLILYLSPSFFCPLIFPKISARLNFRF